MSTLAVPVVFIHGLWLHSSSWMPWQDRFRQAGYDPVAPGWPGEPATIEAARSRPEAVAGMSLDDITAHYETIIRSLERAPIIVGHSIGGLIAQRLLGTGLGAAAIAIDSAQIKGVLQLPWAQLRTALPVLRNPSNRNRAVSLTKEQFRFGFGNALSRTESDALFDQWTIPGPARPLFQAAFANLAPNAQARVDTAYSPRGPLLLMAGKEDHTVPDVIVRSTLKRYRRSTALTELQQFAERGHSLTVDHGWPQIAEAALKWLKIQNL